MEESGDRISCPSSSKHKFRRNDVSKDPRIPINSFGAPGGARTRSREGRSSCRLSGSRAAATFFSPSAFLTQFLETGAFSAHGAALKLTQRKQTFPPQKPLTWEKENKHNKKKKKKQKIMKRKGLKMKYTTMDVGNIFKSLFGIYKTTKLLMQHHNSLHTQAKIKQHKTNNMQRLFFWSFYCKKTTFRD